LSQKPALLLVTGARDVDRKRFAREFEARMFNEGRYVYFLAIGNVLYGVDADLDHSERSRREHVRRLGEVVNILLDAGLIVIASAVALTQQELELLHTTVGYERVAAVWIGDPVGTDLTPDLVIGEREAGEEAGNRLKTLLQDKGVIFRP
jgi:bifunctional enzyme CysN/CysC